MNSDELKILREKLGLSQDKLAQALHISFATVNRWENGKEIPRETAKLLECLNALLLKASERNAKVKVEEIKEAVETAGIAGVVSSAAVAGILPRTLLLGLAALPAFGWIAGLVGIGVLSAIPFFSKLSKKDVKDSR